MTPDAAATTVLGIETSCDETAAAVVRRGADGRGEILSNVVLSQIAEHAAFGGVVPEIAARAHVDALDGVIRAAMTEAATGWSDVDAVAVTAGPGLIGGLLVGVATARALAAARRLPLLPLNHLEGHALTATLTDGTPFPYLLLLVSGGTRSSLRSRALAATVAWAPPLTTRWVKRSTRLPSSSDCPIRAGPPSSGPRWPGMPDGSPCRGRCSAIRAAISHSRA